MPPPPLLNIAELDCSRILYSREQIYRMLPQQYEMSQLDGIIHTDKSQMLIAAFRDVRPDEWWCRGHMPGKPIFPGVLMMETAAQLSAFAQQTFRPLEGGFMGFGGINEAKFRDSVIPPQRIVLAGRVTEARSRSFTCAIQAYVAQTMVFEGLITGIQLKL